MEARKSKKDFDALIEEGYSKEEVSNVHAPIGLDIKAQTPAEISISILAELIKIKKTQSLVRVFRKNY